MLPQNSTDSKPCLQLQIAIDAAADIDKSVIRPPENTAYNFLTSDANKSASTLKIVSDFQGKYADSDKKGLVKVQYYPESCEAEDDDTEVNRCADNATEVVHTGKTTKEFYTDIYHKFTYKVNRDGQRDVCYDVEEVKRDLLTSKRRIELRTIDKKIWESVIASIGGYLNQSSPVNSLTNPDSSPIIDPKSFNYNPGAITLFENQFTKKDFMGDVAWFSDTNSFLNIAKRMGKVATTNTSLGIDPSKVTLAHDAVHGFNGFSGFTANQDHIVGVPYGSYNLIQWWANAGAYDEGKQGFLPGTNAYKTRMDLWGYTWDVKVERQGCWDLFFFELRLGVVVVPTGACKDRLALHFLGTCGELDCAALAASMGL